MKRSKATLTKYLDEIVLLNRFPTERITFYGVELDFRFTTTLPSLSELDKPGSIITYITPLSIAQTIPAVLLNQLMIKYTIYYRSMSDDLIEFFDEYCKSDDSRLNWILYGESLPRTGLYNLFQRNWTLYHSAKDKEENVKMIADTIKILQPWLNLDLYKAMQKSESETRHNAFLDSYELSEEGIYEEAMKIAQRKKIT